MNLMVNETWVNTTKGHGLGESGVYETYTDKVAELFRAMQKEYGRCVSKMYIDAKDGAKHIGWVFQKRKQYDNCKETFILETWVSVHEQKDTIQVHYATL